LFDKTLVLLGLVAVLAVPPSVCAQQPDPRIIREIRINGLINTHEQLVRDQLTSAPGEPYS
jgi:hypothetical protein